MFDIGYIEAVISCNNLDFKDKNEIIAICAANSYAVIFGLGRIFSVAGSTALTATGTAIKEAVGGVGLAIVQAGTHAVAQGVMSLMQGGTFQQAFWSGALGSLGAYAFGAAVGSDFANKTLGQIAFGALSGGIGAELSGGNFWQGAVIGGIVAGLNHAMHKISNSIEERSIAERELNAVGIEDINATAPNTQESLDKVLSTETLSSMHTKSGNVGITYGTPSDNSYLGETTPNAGSTRATGIIINQSKTFSYFKLYGTLGHELTHAIDYIQGTALSIFRRYYKQNPKTAQTRYNDRLEYRAYQWEVKYAPTVLGTQWYNYYQTKYGWK